MNGVQMHCGVLILLVLVALDAARAQDAVAVSLLVKAKAIRSRWNATGATGVSNTIIRSGANGTVDMQMMRATVFNFSWFRANPWIVLHILENNDTCAINTTLTGEQAHAVRTSAVIRERWGGDASTGMTEALARAQLEANLSWASANPWLQSNGVCA